MSQSSLDDLPRKQQIEKFLNSHKSKSQLPEVSVKEMRHIIPLFFMETHIEKCGHYTKKVKGLWERRPSDWPPNVPFVDPNNKLKNEGGKGCKPKKELLGQMLDYLIKRYEKAPRNDGPAFDLGTVIPLLSDPGLPMMDLVESDDPLFGQSIDNSVDQNQLMQELFHSSSGSDYSQSMPHSMPLDLDNYEGNDEFEFENSVLFESIQEQEEMIKPHGQAMDNDDYNGGEDWNPLAQLQRIQQKLSFLEKQKSMKSAELKSMVSRYKELKEVAKAPSNWLSLIDNLHALEKDIDIMKFSSRMSPSRFNEISFDKTTDLMKPDHVENEPISIYMVADDACNEVPIGVEDPELMTSLNIEPRSGGPQDSGPVNNLSLRFVSGPAPEVLNTSSKVSMLSENCYGGSRQAEYMSQPLSDAQYFSFPMSTTLSENCKPIQAAEDDIPPCQNPLPDLGDLQLLQENTNFTLDEVLSFLNISNGIESNTRTLAPVQETNTINLAYLDVGQVNAVGGSTGAMPQLIFSSGNGLGVESSSPVSIASADATKNVTISTEFLHLLLQQASRGFVQPAPAMAEQKLVSMVNGFQPQAANNSRYVKPSGKRSRLLLDDEEMEVTVSNLQPSPEGSCSTLIPTMVEEMGISDTLLRFPKKSKRMT